MAKDFAKAFYSSRAWRDCRAAYRKSVGGLCERCAAKGLIVAGEIVHHKEYITPENLTDPAVALSFDNLELLCRECHEREHRQKEKRYTVDDCGRVHALGDPPIAS